MLLFEKGECAFVTIDQDPEWRKRRRPAGRYVSTAWIPGGLLAEGSLLVDSNLITLDPDELQFSAQNAVTIRVVVSSAGESARGEFARDIPGVVRPLLKWTTECRSG